MWNTGQSRTRRVNTAASSICCQGCNWPWKGLPIVSVYLFYMLSYFCDHLYCGSSLRATSVRSVQLVCVSLYVDFCCINYGSGLCLKTTLLAGLQAMMSQCLRLDLNLPCLGCTSIYKLTILSDCFSILLWMCNRCSRILYKLPCFNYLMHMLCLPDGVLLHPLQTSGWYPDIDS